MPQIGSTPTRYAYNGDVGLAFEDLGGTGGEPLLLVMGLAASRFWWPQGLVDELLARGFHVVAFDQRDAGESSRCPAPPRPGGPVAGLFSGRTSAAYTAEDMVDDAIAVLDAVGWESAHLFGHSMGGLMAQRIALRHPDRVRGVASSSALPSDVGGLGVLPYLRLGFLLRMSTLHAPEGPEGDRRFRLAVARALASPGFPYDESVALECIRREDERGLVSFRHPGEQNRQISAPWSGGRLAELRMPALVLHGEDDQILRTGAARRTAEAIKDARLVTFPGVGHFLPKEVWPAYAEELGRLARRSRHR